MRSQTARSRCWVLATRAKTLAEQLGFVLSASDDSHVYFVDLRGRAVYARAMPIDVAPVLQEQLFQPTRAVVLTSATLAVDAGFEHLRSRLGIKASESEELLLPSPFDYSKQTVLYVPRGKPEPRSPEFVDQAASEVVALLEHSRGRAFVLFTSYANMNAVAERVAGEVDFPLMIHGEAPKPALLEMFRRTKGAVLFATASFWQGVDVVGDQLSCGDRRQAALRFAFGSDRGGPHRSHAQSR